MPCPYKHNSMHVVGHHHDDIRYGVWKMRRDFLPTCLDDFSGIVHSHLTIHHLAEQTSAVLRADGDEIRARLRVVVPFEPNRTAAAFLGIVVQSRNSLTLPHSAGLDSDGACR